MFRISPWHICFIARSSIEEGDFGFYVGGGGKRFLQWHLIVLTFQEPKISDILHIYHGLAAVYSIPGHLQAVCYALTA